MLERSPDDSCSVESADVEDSVERAVRLANDKQKNIGMTLLHQALWFERILCRGERKETESETMSENPVLYWRESTRRKSVRSVHSRYKLTAPEIVHEEDGHLSSNVILLSPNRDDECRPSMWGYNSASLTDSSVSEQ